MSDFCLLQRETNTCSLQADRTATSLGFCSGFGIAVVRVVLTRGLETGFNTVQPHSSIAHEQISTTGKEELEMTAIESFQQSMLKYNSKETSCTGLAKKYVCVLFSGGEAELLLLSAICLAKADAARGREARSCCQIHL